jgi:hypothetical protein
VRLLLFHARRFAWTPDAGVSEAAVERPDAGAVERAIVAFCHAEAGDGEAPGKVITKTIKNVKWLAGKFETKRVVLHSFGHLGGDSAPAELAGELLVQAARRLETAGYEVQLTPFGWSCAFDLQADGPALAKVFKHF